MQISIIRKIIHFSKKLKANLFQNRVNLQTFIYHLLWFLGSGGSDTNHPDQEHEQDQEDDGSSDAWNVIKIRKTVNNQSFVFFHFSPPAM